MIFAVQYDILVVGDNMVELRTAAHNDTLTLYIIAHSPSWGMIRIMLFVPEDTIGVIEFNCYIAYVVYMTKQTLLV